MKSAGVIGGDGGGLGGCGVSTNELTISRMCAIPVLPEFDAILLEVCDGLSMVNGASVAVAIAAESNHWDDRDGAVGIVHQCNALHVVDD